MKFANGILLSVITVNLLIFTGCSQKEEYEGNTDIDSIYKNSSNTQINNSRAMHRATMRPYEVFGIKYKPFIPSMGQEFTGVASWYGPNFHAKKTSNGETYDMYAMTAAHKTLPMNTMVKVDNLENGRTTVVRINDRGPFIEGRIIDLSNTAAHKIDMVGTGTAKVRIKVVGFNGELGNYEVPKGYVPPKDEVDMGSQFEAMEPLDIEENTVLEDNSVSVNKKYNEVVGTPVSKSKVKKIKNPNSYRNTNMNNQTMNSNYKYRGLSGYNSINSKNVYKNMNTSYRTVTGNSVRSSAQGIGSFSLQMGAFSKMDGALDTKNKLQRNFNNKVETKKAFTNGQYFYKVFIKGFSSYEQAASFREQNNLSNAVIVPNED